MICNDIDGRIIFWDHIKSFNFKRLDVKEAEHLFNFLYSEALFY